MEFEAALDVADDALFESAGRRLTPVETAILRGAWQRQTYEHIASEAGYSDNYLKLDVGPKLWKLLSEAFGEKVTKPTFQAAVERQWRRHRGRQDTVAQSPQTVHPIQAGQPQAALSAGTSLWQPQDRTIVPYDSKPRMLSTSFGQLAHQVETQPLATSTQSSGLAISLLGGFSLRFQASLALEPSSKSTQALLAYLVLHCQRPQPRQQIAFQLWPESTDEQARANLRKELSRLRQALPNPEKYLKVDPKMLQWLPDSPFTLDVAEFEAAVNRAEQVTTAALIQAELEPTIELYRGNLLPGLDDGWIVAERERCQQVYRRALLRLIQGLEQQQEYAKAISFTQRLVHLDALDETAYALLMRLYGLQGDRTKALQIYHQCMAILQDELGIDPSVATRQLYERLLLETEPIESSTVQPLPPLPLPQPPNSARVLPPLIGREQEWALIARWAEGLLTTATTAPAASVLLLVGEPGIGKTRLLEELRIKAQAHSAQVLWGQGFMAETMRPYGIWIDALRSAERRPEPTPWQTHHPGQSISAQLGFLLPELGQPTQAPPDISQLFDAVVQLLTQWATQAPLLVLLDDSQWMDDASAALLHYALRLLRPLPVWFALATRAEGLDSHSAIGRVMQTLRREQRL
ncbi:MAG: AAA family ATPase, partial [Leptolyngbyaceae cyanobacterium SM2_5_2]|nr:AAA family ATPase [Leptolyngbyaceae cyanobacterium SM2_5_2]